MTENEARASLLDAARRMAPLGINTGRAGNASMRWHRGGEDGLLVTPSALVYERMTIDDLVWLPLAVAEGEDPAAPSPSRAHGERAPSSEWRLHRDVYALRSDAQASSTRTRRTRPRSPACRASMPKESLPSTT